MRGPTLRQPHRERPHLVGDRTGGAIIVWEDNRRWYKVDNLDIYAQRVMDVTHYAYLPLIAKKH